MDRRTFLGAAAAAVVAEGLILSISFAAAAPGPLKTDGAGPADQPVQRSRGDDSQGPRHGFTNCFLSLDGYINKFTPEAAKQIGDLLAKYEVTATTVEVVGPPPLEWNFTHGPSTIGLVPPKTRAARIDALRQASDFGETARR